jgi:ornithine decarboxylase
MSLVSARVSRIRHIISSGQVTPFLYMDAGISLASMKAMLRAMPEVIPHYAVKANPSSAILSGLAPMPGVCLDVASPAEINLGISNGFSPSRMTYGNTLRWEADTAMAFHQGIRLFATDSVDECRRMARAAPGAGFYVRLDVPSGESEWPLARKFGCTFDEALEVIRVGHELGLRYDGLSFHVGSQQLSPSAYVYAIEVASRVAQAVRAELGLSTALLNIGGGFPVQMQQPVPSIADFASEILPSLKKHFPFSRFMSEPGRFVAAPGGIMVSRVLAVASRRGQKWAYLDVGRFSGLAETEGEAIRYQVINADRKGDMEKFVLAGPTCDGADIMYEKNQVLLPRDTRAGDLILIPQAGAYTTVYAAQAFNGMAGPCIVEEKETTSHVRAA